MSLTDKAYDLLVEPVSKKIAEIVSKDIANMVSNALKEEILEAQKYRIDKEHEIELRRQNLALPNFCPICSTLTATLNTAKSHYYCISCNLNLGNEPTYKKDIKKISNF